MKIAIYPGTFDPITNGHLDIIKRSAKIFDTLIIGIPSKENSTKKHIFTLQERVELVNQSINQIEGNIVVNTFNGLLVDFCHQEKVNVIVRGLRALSDYEYEFNMALMNRSLDENINTIFMIAHQKYTHISSSLLKEIAFLKGDVKNYVPKHVSKCLIEKYDDKK